MKKKQVVNLLAFVLIISLGILGMNVLMASKKPVEVDKPTEPIKYVKSILADNKIHQYSIEYGGNVLSSQSFKLKSEVGGKILQASINFKQGTSFKKGDTLVKIENDILIAKLKSLKSNLITQISKLLPDIQVDFESEYPKWEQFFNAIELNKHLPEFPTFKSQKEKIYLSANSVYSLYFDIVQQEITLGKYNLLAPFNGAIQECNSEVGAIASPNSAIATLIRTDDLEIQIPVSVYDSREIKLGSEVLITDDWNNRKKGRVVRKSSFVNSKNQMIDIYVRVDHSQFYEGEYVKAFFNLQTQTKGVKLAREALTQEGKIYVISNNHLKSQSVQMLYKTDDYVIVSGILEGTQVVNESMVSVDPKQKFKALID